VMRTPTSQHVARGEAARRAAQNDRGAGRPASADSQAAVPALGSEEGAALFAGACASCHDGSRPQPFGGLNLHLSSAVNSEDPRNIANVVLFGLPGSEGERSAIMPGYAGAITDAQLVALLRFMRARFSDRAEWDGLDETVKAARAGGGGVVRPSDGTTPAPADASARGTLW
jgi:mono/diheme cytochrome c family protein